jgi:FtsP/CotA-like multicopper oxidase with cupredoxin domain
MRHLMLLAALGLTLAAGGSRFVAELPTASPNPNITRAGTLRDGVLTLALDAQLVMWHPDGDSLPGIAVEAFAEAGKAPLAPGPMIRVPLGTTINASVKNSLAGDTIVFHFVRGSADDSVVIAPGVTQLLSVAPTRAGAFFYRASKRGTGALPLQFAGMLHGALIVDPVGAPATPNDRVFVISGVSDTIIPGSRIPSSERAVWALNGRSWPRTERFSFTVGDSVRWRVINATDDQHPMHLHGFYYRVDEFEGPELAVRGQGIRGRMVVTERLAQRTTMSITWVPERPGNWLFHCHFQEHLVPHGAFNVTTAAGVVQRIARWPTRTGPEHVVAQQGQPHPNHALTGMAGLVIGVQVRPRPGQRVAEPGPGRRKLRVVAVKDSAFAEPLPSLRFLLDDPRAARAGSASRLGISPTIRLVKGEPVSITIVNRMAEPTAIHWHGIELESYHDGVAGFGGFGNRITPIIAPSDSFEARFTPPRSGTFIYHSHVDEVRQHRAGLVGALIVEDRAGMDTTRERIFVLKSARGSPPIFDLNGVARPDTMELVAGTSYRLRFVAIQKGNPILTISITARPDSSMANAPDSMLVQWRPVAKDGADLPLDAHVLKPARQPMGMGETYDFDFVPDRTGNLRIEVRSARGLVYQLPIRAVARPQ